jgi:hypothetical protein
MKINYNLDKDTFSIKNIEPHEFAVINALMSHVRLGIEAAGSDVAFDFRDQVDSLEVGIPETTVLAEPSESNDNLTVIIQSPTLEVYVD